MKVIIWAVLQSSENPKLDRGIGKANKTLVNIKTANERFNSLTKGHTVIMGRFTYESLPDRLRPIIGRRNIVISKSPEFYPHKDVIVVASLTEAIKEAAKFEETEIFIIGGEKVFEQAFSDEIVDTLEIVLVSSNIKADRFFPKWESFGKITYSESGVDPKTGLEYTFLTIEKNK